MKSFLKILCFILFVLLVSSCSNENNEETSDEYECLYNCWENPYAEPDKKTGSFTESGEGSQTVLYDKYTGLAWSQRIGLEKWSEAVSGCQNLSYYGCDKWRLPNVSELETLISYSKFEPYKKEYFGGWSASVSIKNPDEVWTVGQNGYVVTKDSKNGVSYFNCVCGPENEYKKEKNRFVQVENDETDGAIVYLDVKTNLQWKIGVCEGQWDEPTVNELRTLLNRKKSEGLFTDFPNMPSKFYLTSDRYLSGGETDGTEVSYGINFENGFIDDSESGQAFRNPKGICVKYGYTGQ